MSERIEGRRPVLAALRAGRVRSIQIASATKHAIIEEIRELAASKDVPVEDVARGMLDAASMTGKHQGVIAEVEPRRTGGWEASVQAAKDEGRAPLLVVLDGIQDPGNLGAILRSAAAFSADAVVIPQDRAAPVTEVAAKAAAGALEVLDVLRVPSLQAVVERAKELGLWSVAVSEEGEATLRDSNLLSGPLVLIVGAEGRGVSRTLKAAADELVRIPTSQHFSTLNASNAAAIALYEVHVARS